MDRMLYLAMNGAKQTMIAQQANTHNLANANTTGFRQDLITFEAVPVEGPGFESRTYALTRGPSVSLEQGPTNATGRALDVAINGPGFFAVQAADGTEAYTRAGDLRIGPGGVLTTGRGDIVLGNGGPIALEAAESVVIGTDGTISIRPVGEGPDNILEVNRLKLVNPDPATLEKRPDGLIGIRGGELANPDAAVTVLPGSREGSNVSAVDSMVNMISLSRSYELSVKMMQVAEENDAASASLLRLNG